MNNYKGIDYLRIDIANNSGGGRDKLPFSERITWVQEHEDVLEDIVDITKKPFQYLAAVMAYRDAQKGIPTGHLVGLDAGASGLQISAILTGCHTTAQNTGLIGDTCNDIYTITTKEMGLLLGEEVTIDRKLVKGAQMPHYYGSEQKPKDVFGDGTEEYNTFHQANQTVAPGANELRNILISAWQPWALQHQWTMPDGFEVVIPTMVQEDIKIEVDELDHAAFVYRHQVNQGIEKGLALAAHVHHAIDGMIVRELSRRCNYDRNKLRNLELLIKYYLPDAKGKFTSPKRIESLALKSGFYSLVGIESVNANTVKQYGKAYLSGLLSLVQDTLQYKSFPVVAVHDEFKSHPNNCDRVRQVYIDIMAEMAESDMLSFIMTQITGKYFEVAKYSNDLGDRIREGEYGIS